jgi:NADH dehydrogenase [ubiquinone] 1 alpha subcomplex assembly factor 6
VCIAQVIGARQLTRYRLQQIVNAREQDLLNPGQPADTAQLEAYAEGTASQLLYLQVPHAASMAVLVLC